MSNPDTPEHTHVYIASDVSGCPACAAPEPTPEPWTCPDCGETGDHSTECTLPPRRGASPEPTPATPDLLDAERARTADPSGLPDKMAVKDAVMRLPTHDHVFDDTPYLRRLDVLDLIDTLALAASPSGEPTPRPDDSRYEFVAMVERARSEHEATHGEAEMCGYECVVLGLDDPSGEPTLDAADISTVSGS